MLCFARKLAIIDDNELLPDFGQMSRKWLVLYCVFKRKNAVGSHVATFKYRVESETSNCAYILCVQGVGFKYYRQKNTQPLFARLWHPTSLYLAHKHTNIVIVTKEA